MSEGVKLVLIPGLVSLVIAVLGYFGVRFTARQTTKAKKEEIEAGAYTRAQSILEAAATRQDKEIARLGAAFAEQEERHRRQINELGERHRQEIAELRQERREQHDALNARIDELEARDDASRKRVESLTAYIRACLRLLKEGRIPPPEPAPPGITFD